MWRVIINQIVIALLIELTYWSDLPSKRNHSTGTTRDWRRHQQAESAWKIMNYSYKNFIWAFTKLSKARPNQKWIPISIRFNLWTPRFLIVIHQFIISHSVVLTNTKQNNQWIKDFYSEAKNFGQRKEFYEILRAAVPLDCARVAGRLRLLLSSPSMTISCGSVNKVCNEGFAI